MVIQAHAAGMGSGLMASWDHGINVHPQVTDNIHTNIHILQESIIIIVTIEARDLFEWEFSGEGGGGVCMRFSLPHVFLLRLLDSSHLILQDILG